MFWEKPPTKTTSSKERKVGLEKDDKERRSFAELAAAQAKPHVYQLVSSSKTESLLSSSESSEFESFFTVSKSKASPGDLRFFVLGCQGNATASQAKVAGFMNRLAKEHKPDFILILGDNFYDWGVDSPLDPMFTTNFYNIYTNEAKVPEIANIPCFVILGNHDENLHHAKLPFQESGIARGMHQVAHSYLGQADTKYPTTESKIDLYTNDKLDIDHLPSWNMPSRFYSLISGDTQLFCIDSNTYVKDFLNSMETKEKESLEEFLDLSQPNQASWLKHLVEKAYGDQKKTILALHHPPMTPGKRAFQSDLKLYLTEEEIKKAQTILHISDKEISHMSYNELIRRVFIAQKIAFNLTLSAHDHAIYYFNNTNSLDTDYPICQVTSGGGGGSLQERLGFGEQQQMGCFLEQHGFTEVFSPAKNNKIFFNIYTPKSILKFDNRSSLPKRTFPKEIDEVEQQAIQTFCNVVYAALRDYFQFLDAKQMEATGKFLSKNFFKGGNISHGQEGVKRAHKIWAYICNATADDLGTTINTVYEMSKWKGVITNPTAHSFITILNKKLVEHYQDDTITIENLSQKIKEHTPQKVTYTM